MIRSYFHFPFDYRVPQLFRYLDQEYVEQFLNSGRLRLSSFHIFRNHEDERRKDDAEGLPIIEIFGNPGYVNAKGIIEGQFYVICTSSDISKEIAEQFNANSCFVISVVCLFAQEIAKSIPGCDSVIFGACNYHGTTNVYAPDLNLSRMRGNNNLDSIRNEVYPSIQAILNTDGYFVKHRTYIEQREYRFLFHVDRTAENALFIESKSAAELCMKVLIPT